jgi:putative acetyltransferase
VLVVSQEQTTQLQTGVTPAREDDFARLLEVWEASVRATHHFVSEADIEVFRPMVQDAFPQVPELHCIRDSNGLAVGFIGVVDTNIEMLFIHPSWRGQGGGKQLVEYAIFKLGATTVDVNEQNEQAVGFYLRMGFEVIGRSALDSTGKPYPLLHMCLANAVNNSLS